MRYLKSFKSLGGREMPVYERAMMYSTNMRGGIGNFLANWINGTS